MHDTHAAGASHIAKSKQWQCLQQDNHEDPMRACFIPVQASSENPGPARQRQDS